MSFFKQFWVEIVIGAAVVTLVMLIPTTKPSQLQAKRNPANSSIVRLVLNDRTFCTGTVINDHTVLTAAHCVLVETQFGVMMNPSPIEIRANDNLPKGAFATPYYATPQMDQALLKGDFKGFATRPYITNVQDLTTMHPVGKRFISCGYPLGGDMYCNSTYYQELTHFMWAVNGVLLPGMSGGPTMLEDGTVVAVNVTVGETVSIVSPIYNLETNFEKD